MKKIISAILVLAMCISMIGGISVSALDADTNGVVTYTFSKAKIMQLNNVTTLNANSAWQGVNFWNPNGSIGGAVSAWYPTSVIDFGNHGWKYFGVGADIEKLINGNNNAFRMLQLGNDYQAIYNSNSNASAVLDGDATTKLSYELEKPVNTGFYCVTVKSAGVSNSTNPTADFYMNPYSASLTADGSASEKALLGTVSYSNTTAADADLAKIIYVDGVKNLIFTMNPHQKPLAGTYTNNGINAYSAKLTPVSGNPSFSISSEVLNVSDSLKKTAQIEVKVGDYAVANSFVSYSVKGGSSNIATVDENGLITALAKGSVTIVATVGEYSHEFDITVVDVADRTYYFAKKGNVADNNVVVNTITVGVDYNEAGVLDTGIINSKFYATSIGGFGTHGWKYYDINDAIYEEYVGVQPRLFQANADNLRINGTYITNTTDPEVRAAVELEAPTKPGFYVISTNTGTAGVNFYTGPKKTVIVEGAEVKDVDNYVNEAHLVGTTVQNTSTYATDGDDIKIDKQTAPVMAVYSDGKTSMILAYRVGNTTSIDLRGYKLTYVENADPVIKCGDEIGKNIGASLKNGNRGRIQVRTAANGGVKVTDSFVAYSSDKPDVVSIDNAGIITAKSVGEATITAEIGGAMLTVKVTVFDQDAELSEAFDVTSVSTEYTAPTVTGVTIDGGVIKANGTNGTFTLTAEPEKNGKKFLYWAKGKSIGKKIISFSNELTNYMPEENDKNHILIAVYEGDVSNQEEWYNANGQRIAAGAEPALPSMAGYGEAEGWDDYSEMIHVARYALKVPAEDIDITVKNGSGSGTYAYGDTVTCTADEATNGKFKCWTKSGINGKTEIVSMEKTYTFMAWESCTVTAVYDENYYYTGNKMKIIIDMFTAGNEKAVMAEFIGFGNNAVERGIMYNGTKIAMTKPGTQFTLTGIEGDSFTGYAIVGNETDGYKLITDGSATIE